MKTSATYNPKAAARSALHGLLRAVFAVTILIFPQACASRRQPVPAGVVPSQGSVQATDEQYGHEVLNGLTKSYPLDRNDDRINRVRDVVDRLTRAAKADHNPWHVYVLKGDDFKNAAATRGNYIFVWTGMLKTVQSDAELATILAHEIGHVLAGHTEPDPAEETSKIIAGVAGAATGGILGSRGYGGPVADLAELIIRASLEALLVNPETQVKELEADQIGIFMMADAGYNPEDAVRFWERVKTDPDFAGFPIEFMSSHPSSEERYKRLSALLPDARQRYIHAGSPAPPALRRGGGGNQFEPEYPSTSSGHSTRKEWLATSEAFMAESSGGEEIWTVADNSVKVYSRPDTGSRVIESLKLNTEVSVKRLDGRWLEITAPLGGFVKSSSMSPTR